MFNVDKIQLRQSMIEKLEQLSTYERNNISSQLINHLLSSSLWKTAKVIGVTISQALEWSTKPIIKAGWEQGKTIAVPKCYPDDKKLVFYKFTSYNQLEVVYYNLQEPNPEKTTAIDKNDMDLLIVPGLVYDKDGYRIGFGGGYYDRFLTDFRQTTVSLASRRQIVEEIPYESYDIPVDHIITDKGMIK